LRKGYQHKFTESRRERLFLASVGLFIDALVVRSRPSLSDLSTTSPWTAATSITWFWGTLMLLMVHGDAGCHGQCRCGVAQIVQPNRPYASRLQKPPEFALDWSKDQFPRSGLWATADFLKKLAIMPLSI
jgi:hypothetical protein